VTTQGGFAPIEALDGSRLYFTTGRDDTVVWERLGSVDRPIIRGLGHWSHFAVSSEGLFYLVGESGTNDVSFRFLNLSTNSDVLLGHLKGPVQLGLSVSPDAKRALFTRLDYSSSDIMISEFAQSKDVSVIGRSVL
jgi:hypothetical protein